MKILIWILAIISCSAYAADIDLVKVDKSERVMQLLSSDKVIKEYSIALGANPKGDKQQ